MAFNYHDVNQQGIPLNGIYTDHNFNSGNNNGNQNMFALDQSTVLNSNDQSYLDSFFNNPNAASEVPIPPAASYDMSFKPDMISSPIIAGGAHHFALSHGNINPSTPNVATTSPFVEPSPTTYKGQADGGIGRMGTGEHTPNWVHQPHVNPASKDNAAATSLMNLKSTQSPQDQFHNFGGHGQQPPGGPASWANLAGTSYYNPSMPPPNNAYTSMPSGPPTNQTRHSSMSHATRPQNDYINHLARVRQSATQQHAQRQSSQPPSARARHMSIDATSPTAGSAPQNPSPSSSGPYLTHAPRPHIPIRFGSDDNFGSAGYRAPSSHAPHPDRHKTLLAFGYGSPNPPPNYLSEHLPHSSDIDGSRDAPTAYSSATDAAPAQAAPMSVHASQPTGLKAWEGFGGSQNQESSEAEPAHKRRKSRADGDGDSPYVSGSGGAKRGQRPLKRERSEDEAREAIAQPSSSVKRRKTETSRTDPGSDASGSPENEIDDDEDEKEGSDSAKKKARGKQKTRENLSESQKRHNHIMSEKKRREVINQGYSDLNKLVPCLAQGKSGMSRSECLLEAASYLETQVAAFAKLKHLMGLSPDDAGHTIGGAVLHPTHPATGAQFYGDQDYYDD